METAWATRGRKRGEEVEKAGEWWAFFHSVLLLMSRWSRTEEQPWRRVPAALWWMVGAQEALPWQGPWHALLCRRLFSQDMFTHYFIAWACLVGTWEERPAWICRAFRNDASFSVLVTASGKIQLSCNHTWLHLSMVLSLTLLNTPVAQPVFGQLFGCWATPWRAFSNKLDVLLLAWLSAGLCWH